MLEIQNLSLKRGVRKYLQVQTRVWGQLRKRMLCLNPPIIGLNKPSPGGFLRTPQVAAEVGVAGLLGAYRTRSAENGIKVEHFLPQADEDLLHFV